MLYRCFSCTLAHPVVIAAMLVTAVLVDVPQAAAKSDSAATKGDLPFPLHCIGAVVGSEAAVCPSASSGHLLGPSTVMEARNGNTSVLWRVDARGGPAEATSR